MSAIHALVGQLALVLGAVAVLWSVVLAALRRPPGTLFVASLVWLVIAIVAAGLLGVLTAVTVAPPRDPLHIVYGLIAAAILPGAALLARRRLPAQQTIVAAVASLILLILLFRLLETGH
jgi:hypothetical protein